MSIADSIIGNDPIHRYLRQCRVRNTLVENDKVHVPPAPDEVQDLLKYLKTNGVSAAIVGSVGVLHYVKDEANFRPTVDLDIFVHKTAEDFRKISPPQGWSIDKASPGVISWISPSGGYVDFMTSGHEFPGGSRTPSRIAVDPSSKDYPVATAVDLFKLKLNSMREKDVTDLIGLARAIGGIPSEQQLGRLNQTQRENLQLVQQWFKIRPTGKYGT
jgi:hypothetical protein